MRLVVSTPSKIVLDADGVDDVRAEDTTGSFGVGNGHERFVSVLTGCVVRWSADGVEHFIAVDRAVITSDRADGVHIAARRAELADDPEELQEKTLQRFRESVEREERARTQARDAEVALINRLGRYVSTKRVTAPKSTGPGAGE